MTRIAEVKAVERNDANGVRVLDVQVDPGGGALVTAEHFGSAGDDSPPLPGDMAALEDSAGKGVEQVVGYQDIKNPSQAADGERRLYGRDSRGAVTCELWLKGDSEAVLTIFKDGMALRLKNDNGPIILDSKDCRIGTGAGRQIACVGDLVSGSVRALCTAPGNPAIPAAGAPTPTGGIPFVGRIISGSAAAKAP